MTEPKRFSSLVKELPKSQLPASAAVAQGVYPFFVSGPVPKRCDKYLHQGMAIVMSTGGNAAIHFGHAQFGYSTDCWALEPKRDEVYPPFLYQWLSNKQQQIDHFGFEGSGLRHLKKDYIRSLEVDLPSPLEQEKIAQIFSVIDNAIEQTEAIIAKQQRIETGLMHDLLTKGIDEHGNVRSETSHAFKDSPIGRIPVEWETKLLDDCVRAAAPICYGILMPGTGVDDGVPVIKVKDIFDGTICLDNILLTDPRIDAAYKRSRLREGDLLITIRGTTGRVAMVPVVLDGGNITQDTARIRLKEEYIPSFMFYVLQSANVQAQVVLHTLGQAVKGINIAEVRKLNVPVPSNNEQLRINRILDRIHSNWQANSRCKEKLKLQKVGLMHDLLTGKVRVADLLKQQAA